VAKSFLGDLQTVYSRDELDRLNNMLSTVIDDQGHGLGDSRLFIRAAAKAARKFDEVLRKKEGGEREDGQKQIKYHMPLDPGQRRGLVAEAKRILDLELMNARNEYIRRSGRSLPGWWR
jgi:adenine C2-methylase RlmN of 23S rRNA A2503 and tRNA A37